MQNIAKSRYGKCLSKNYTNIYIKLKWQCKEGHVWEAKPCNILSGSWCVKCNKSVSISEQMCCRIFELLFNKEFIKVRPKWLKYKNGKSLELDGYCKKIKLAFEYNGSQHYKYSKRFHKNQQHLEKIKKRDYLKKELTKKHDINLIVIPYTVKYKNMKNYIMEECIKLNINIPCKDLDINYRTIKLYNNDRLLKLNNFVYKKGGKCLSKTYLGAHKKLKFKCNKGHIWSASPSAIINVGRWCPYCAGNKKKTIQFYQNIAKKKGGKCLSKDNIYKRKLEFQCKKGHTWKTMGGNITSGTWCPYCAGNMRKE